MAIFLRSGFPFNYDTLKASTDSGLKCADLTLAKDSMREESDINTIVRRFNLTGQLPENFRSPQYVDFEGVFDFQTAMNAVRQADEAFMQMPADLRARFHNDPQELVAFVGDADNYAEAVKLKLVPAKPEPEAPGAAVAAPKPPEGASPGGSTP